MDTNPDRGYKCATLFQKKKAGVSQSDARVKNMDKEFLRQVDQASELLTQAASEKLSDDVLICECFCVNVRDIREACSGNGEVNLTTLRDSFSLGEGCTGCLKAAPDWINKIF